jgi:Aerobic-type carbon monoxide dehydrogenase, large subunit CoxL/CutL homologs
VIPNIGQPLDRVDGRLKVTGGARFAIENKLANVAYGVLVSSTIPSGTIRTIDDSVAIKAPGVLAVISHRNTPKLNPPVRPQPGEQGSSLAESRYVPFSDSTIHYLGQHIAVVVADTLEHATHAASLVRVVTEATPARTDMQALRSEAKERSQQNPSKFGKGDADAAFESAAVKIDQIYRTPYEHHNPMEPHGLVAAWNGDHLTLHDSSQNIFAVQRTFAQLFGIPKENVHVLSPFVGGAFGSKGSVWPHVVIGVIAAKVVGRPVKLAVTRKQLFFTNGHRPETEQRVALGATADGKLVSVIHDGICQGNEVCNFVEAVTAPTRVIYASPNIRGSHLVVDLNLPSGTYMRGPGDSTGMFALDSAMDELAYAVKVDPLELRLRNHADEDPMSGKQWSSKSLKECYRIAAEKFGWSRRTPEPRSMHDGRDLIGWGMASANRPAHQAPCSARAQMRANGTVTVSCGSHEMGMGTATVMTQLAAETLGIPTERVRFELGDTLLPAAPISAGSLTAASVGSAVFGVTMELKKKLGELAGVDPASLDPANYTAILRQHYLDHVDAQFDAKPELTEPYSSHAFGAHFVEVAIDPDLPVVRVRRVVSAFAAGKILNEKTARSQCLGGIVWGIGQALLEQTHLDKKLGAFTNVNFAEYLVPVNPDIQSIEVILVPEDDPHVNPIGVKGIGEVSIVGVAPAIANAVYHATGKRVRDLPITIDKLL